VTPKAWQQQWLLPDASRGRLEASSECKLEFILLLHQPQILCKTSVLDGCCSLKSGLYTTGQSLPAIIAALESVIVASMTTSFSLLLLLLLHLMLLMMLLAGPLCLIVVEAMIIYGVASRLLDVERQLINAF
jgi:hypothetical protein